MTNVNRSLKSIAILLCLVSLVGCAGAVISGGTYAIESSKRAELNTLANEGDAQAQYELGKAWCCMGPGFNTQIATEWLCKAAAQNQPEALFELGLIYSGDISRTPAPGQKLLKLAKAKKSEAHALAFFSLAGQLGIEKAARKAKNLNFEVDDVVRFRAKEIQKEIDGACTYEEVFPENEQ